MSTTAIISNLNPSERPRSPVFYQEGPDETEAGGEVKASVSPKPLNEVTQSGVSSDTELEEEPLVQNIAMDFSYPSSDTDEYCPSPRSNNLSRIESNIDVSSSTVSGCSDSNTDNSGPILNLSASNGKKVSHPDSNVQSTVLNFSASSRKRSLERDNREERRDIFEDNEERRDIFEDNDYENFSRSLSVKIERVGSEILDNLVSVKAEVDTDDYEESVDPANSSDSLINVADIPGNDSAMIETLRDDSASDVFNVSEMDVVNVTSTTQETDPVDTPLSPEQEVVDVESYQPCVVDLTCEEEEDDVDVVAVVEPVIFLGTEQGRHNRGNTNTPHHVEDLTGIRIEPQQGENLNDDDDSNNNAVPMPGRENIWDDLRHALNAPELDLQNPNLTFGSLLEQVHVETVDDSQLQPERPVEEPRRLRRRLRPNVRRIRTPSPNLFPEVNFGNEAAPLGNPMDIGDDIIPAPADWPILEYDAPNQLPLNANHAIGNERNHRLARIPAPAPPPPSPPPREQPTISCLVCLDSVATINSSSRTLCSTVCGHVFCSACIEEVVKQRKQCPVCRKRLTKKKYHPLFI